MAHASAASVVIAELLWCCRQPNISLPDKHKRIAKSAKHEGKAEKSSKSRNKFLATLSAYPVVGDQIWHMAVNALLIPCSPILLPLSFSLPLVVTKLLCISGRRDEILKGKQEKMSRELCCHGRERDMQNKPIAFEDWPCSCMIQTTLPTLFSRWGISIRRNNGWTWRDRCQSKAAEKGVGGPVGQKK